MKSIQTIFERIESWGNKPAIFWCGEEYSYSHLAQLIKNWSGVLDENNITKGTICGILGNYSPATSSLFFALMLRQAILVPFTKENSRELDDFLKIAEVQILFRFETDDSWTIENLSVEAYNKLYKKFSENNHPGLVVFSSGSTGKPKGILQDCENVMKKFIDIRAAWRMILFLMMDHFGGFNTLLSTFAYGGTGICLPNRNPETVCRLIEESKATLLPTTPTFLNILIASKVYNNFNLSSIKLITYGTEVMPAETLKNIKEIFPNAQIKQTYGLSELGVLRSKSESDDSVWVKIGGRGFETKVVDNILWIRSESNMVGYLNAEDPFDEEGWMCTGDEVEIKGEFMRILGRKSDMINVGGQKVFPVEVETVLLQAPNIIDASVYGSPHPIMGNVVMANVIIEKEEDSRELNERLRKFCSDKLSKYKIPMKFIVAEIDNLHSERYKRIRKEINPT